MSRQPVVAMDANALMAPVELGVRSFDEVGRLVGECEFVVPRAVVDELTRIAGRGAGTEATAARVGLDLARDRCRIVDADGRIVDQDDRAAGEDDSTGDRDDRAAGEDDSTGDRDDRAGGDDRTNTREPYADDVLVALARDGALDYVATNDAPLRDRLLAAGVPVIGIRGRNKLAITQP